MSLGAFSGIVERICEIVNDIWGLDRIIVGEPRHDPQDTTWAMVDCNPVDRERVGVRGIQERYSFDIIGIFPRQEGDREQVFLMEKAAALASELESDATFITELATNPFVSAAGRLEELPTEQERCGCFVRFTVDSFAHKPDDA